MALPSREISVSDYALVEQVLVSPMLDLSHRLRKNSSISLVVCLLPGVVRVFECVRRLRLSHVVRKVVPVPLNSEAEAVVSEIGSCSFS